MPSDDFWSDLPKRVKPTQAKSVSHAEGELAKPDSAKGRQVGLAARKLVRWAGAILATLVLIAGAVGIAFGILLYEGIGTAANPAATEPVQFEIERGQSARAIARRLEETGLIVSRWPLLAYLQLNQFELRAGVYKLKASQTTEQIANQIATGDVAEQRLTIPEGWRIEQIADQIEKTGIGKRDVFLAAARYDPVRDTLPAGITLEPGDSLEGLLFPDTYSFPFGVTSKEIVTAMLENYNQRTKDLGLTYENLILASIVERESKRDDDRPQVAGVYRNRLKNNLPLDADPTVQYAKDTAAAQGSETGNYTWWSPITAADYQGVKSPFNTYRERGLPPAPICNPGLKSLTAAKTPTEHAFYFFLHGADGVTYFAKTLEEHNRNKSRL